MIEAIMIFALGAITCGLLVLLIMPTIWNRAVRLTRMRLEATSPMTMAEIQGDRDLMRAEFAMQARRLERDVEKLQEMASRQVIEINRKREALALVSAERDEKDQIIEEVEQHSELLQRQAHEADEKAAEAQVELRTIGRRIKHLEGEIDELNEQLEDAHEQIEAQKEDAAADRIERDRLESKIAELKSEKSQLAADMTSVEIDLRMRETDIENRKSQIRRLEERLESTIRDLSDREETLSRRSQELIRLRNAHGSEKTGASAELQARVLDLESRLARTQAENGRLGKQVEELKNGGPIQPADPSVSSKAALAMLELRLEKIVEERDQAKARVAELEGSFDAAMAEEAAANSSLRKLLADIGDRVADMADKLPATEEAAKPPLRSVNGGRNGSAPATARNDDPMIDRILRDAEMLKDSFGESEDAPRNGTNGSGAGGSGSGPHRPIPFPASQPEEEPVEEPRRSAGE